MYNISTMIELPIARRCLRNFHQTSFHWEAMNSRSSRDGAAPAGSASGVVAMGQAEILIRGSIKARKMSEMRVPMSVRPVRIRMMDPAMNMSWV